VTPLALPPDVGVADGTFRKGQLIYHHNVPCAGEPLPLLPGAMFQLRKKGKEGGKTREQGKTKWADQPSAENSGNLFPGRTDPRCRQKPVPQEAESEPIGSNRVTGENRLWNKKKRKKEKRERSTRALQSGPGEEKRASTIRKPTATSRRERDHCDRLVILLLLRTS